MRVHVSIDASILSWEWLYRSERNGQISYLEILLCPLEFFITVFRLLFLAQRIITVGVLNSKMKKKEQAVIEPLFNFFFKWFRDFLPDFKANNLA